MAAHAEERDADGLGKALLEAVEKAASLCAVLAETDVINMVSRGIATPGIIRGIHESIGQRLVKLLSPLKADSPLDMTGGMSRDVGIVEVIRRQVPEGGLGLEVKTRAARTAD